MHDRTFKHVMLVEYKIGRTRKERGEIDDEKGKNGGGVCLHDRAFKHIVLVGICNVSSVHINNNKILFLLHAHHCIITYPLSLFCDDPSMPAWGAPGKGVAVQKLLERIAQTKGIPRTK